MGFRLPRAPPTPPPHPHPTPPLHPRVNGTFPNASRRWEQPEGASTAQCWPQCGLLKTAHPCFWGPCGSCRRVRWGDSSSRPHPVIQPCGGVVLLGAFQVLFCCICAFASFEQVSLTRNACVVWHVPCSHQSAYIPRAGQYLCVAAAAQVAEPQCGAFLRLLFLNFGVMWSEYAPFVLQDNKNWASYD